MIKPIKLELTEHQAKVFLLYAMGDKARGELDIQAVIDCQIELDKTLVSMAEDEAKNFGEMIHLLHGRVGCGNHCKHKLEEQ